MEKIFRGLKNASASSSQSLLKLFKGKRDANKLLSMESIIKGMKIGMSFLNEENKPTILNDVFGSEFTHTSIYFVLELPENRKTGVIIQYGKYEYLDKTKFDNGVVNIGFPYEKEGGLMFGELDVKVFEDQYCTVGYINCILGKNFPKMRLEKFIEEVKKINGPWDLKSYDPVKKSCQDFVVAALQVIKPGFSEQLVTMKYQDFKIPVVVETELKKRETFFDC
jgi:hypothetical protein